jgi:hypothetical protein
MTIAIDALQAIEQLTALASTKPGPNPQALARVHDVLTSMGLNNGATGYKAEKLQAVQDDFAAWFQMQSAASADDPGAARIHMLHNIEHLKKVLARWSESQD